MSVQRQSQSPIFIVGHERSGTTLFSEILGRHTLLYSAPETFVFRALNSQRPNSHEQARRALSEGPAHMSDLGIDLRSLGTEAEGPFALAAVARLAVEQIAKLAPGQRLVEKTPSHYRDVELIFTAFPDAKLIWIVRDGREVALSLLGVPWAHNRLGRHCLAWARSTREMLDAKTKYDASRLMVIRYEDLVSSPEGTLDEVCSFLGIGWEPAMLEPSASGASVRSDEVGWKWQASAVIDRSKLGRWQGETSEANKRMMTYLAEPELRRLGYETRRKSAGRSASYLGFRVIATADRLLWTDQLVRLIGALRPGRWMRSFRPSVSPHSRRGVGEIQGPASPASHDAPSIRDDLAVQPRKHPNE